MTLRGPVLVALDLSAPSDEALRQGSALARRLGDAIVVGHVLPEAYRVRVLFPQDAGVAEAEQEAMAARAGVAVQARVDALVTPGSVPVTVEIAAGTAHAGIVELAERVDAGVIVVGPGETAMQVARAAHRPVLIARPSPANGDVLAATDFSDPALPAIRAGGAEATGRGVALRVIHCVEADFTAALATAGLGGGLPVPPLPDPALQQMEAHAHAEVLDALARCRLEGTPIVLRASAAQGILQAAAEPPAALVAVGTRGRSGLARLMLGSVAEDVARRAPCSVLMVPLSPERA
jgi:nucleotide-binding universal stress UspA family protein